MNLDKDLKTAQDELFEVVATCTGFLNRNGIKLERVKEMIDFVVDDAFEQMSEHIEREKMNNES